MIRLMVEDAELVCRVQVKWPVFRNAQATQSFRVAHSPMENDVGVFASAARR